MINSLNTGGSETQIINLLPTLSQVFHHVDILLLTNQISTNHQQILRKYQHTNVEVFEKRRCLNYFIKWIGKPYRRHSDIHQFIWSWGKRADIFCYFLKLFCQSATFIVSLRSAYEKDLKSYIFLRKKIYRKCQYLISNTYLGMDLFDSIYDDVKLKKIYMPNLIKFSEKQNVKRTSLSFKILMVGNLKVDCKGYDLAIEIARQLKCKSAEIELDIYGMPYEINYFNHINKANHVQFKGYHSNPSELFSQYDVYLMTSRYEGMPNSLIEAMESGMCCLSTKVGDLERLYVNREEIILFNMPLKPRQVVETILELMNDKSKLSEIGGKAREKVTKLHNLPNVKKSLYKILNSNFL